jgi:adenylate cyclase
MLDSLGAAVLVPARRGGILTAFLCLGAKASGDVYTSTDQALLSAVADKLSTCLLLFDDAEVLRQAQEMQAALRRYVPGAVAAQLESGRGLVSGECEVSVLFVDIRGYTAFSENRQAAEIFSTVNRYTETVSEIVRWHGGSVVEFSGDGMMAVFGVPTALPNKERCAVEAGREIVTAMSAPRALDATSQGVILPVGIGIATGAALVGTIQAVDRAIWTVIGNTTNLAARLQGLSRDLDAAIVIDGATRLAAAAAAADFQRRESVPIRGRLLSEDLYVLPLAA